MAVRLFEGKRTQISSETVRRAYEAKGLLVLRRCRLILRNEVAAEDALQEVFIRLLRYGGTVQNDDVPLSWLYRTAERTCFELLKRNKREPLPDTAAVELSFLTADPALASEAREVLEKFFYRLDDKLKQVAILHYVDGLSQERIGEALGWSRRTVYKKLVKIRRIVERQKKGRSEKRIPISFV